MIRTVEEFKEFLVAHERDNVKVEVSPKIQMQVMALGRDVIKHIVNPTPAAQQTAVSANAFALYYIEKPARSVLKIAKCHNLRTVYAS